MYKYLLGFLFLVSTSVFATTGGIYTTDIKSFTDYPTAAKCAGHASDSEVQLVDAAADFSTINTAGVYYYCVEPGAYTTNLDITKVCTSSQRCYIWYYNTSETEETHPVNMATADQAKITGHIFFLSATEYWVVDRIMLSGSTDSRVRIQPGAGNNIILNRMLIEDSVGNHIAAGGDFNLVQNSVLRNSAGQIGFDDLGISFYGEDFKVVGTEIYNIRGDTIQVSNGAEGGLIADTEMYLTSALYTDCSGNLTPTGLCQCAENGLDTKGGALKADNFPFAEAEQLKVIGNHIWGFNRDDDGSGGTCGTGSSSLGLSMTLAGGVAHTDADTGEGIYVKDNVITSGPNNIESTAIIGTNTFSRHHSFINNLFYDLNYAVSLPSAKTDKHEWYYNTFLTMDTALMIGGGAANDWLCNLIINTEVDGFTQGTGDLYDYNAWFNSDEAAGTGSNDYSFTHDSGSQNEMFCYPRNQITNLSAECVPLASKTKESPHGDLCTGVTETATRGVDNVTQLTRIRAGFVAPYLQRTIEIEDSAALTYNFVAPISDNYQVWFRSTTTDTNDNSLSYSIGNSPKQIVKFGYPVTEWRKGGLDLELKAGLHTITVVKREAGIDIDKLVITNNPSYTSP